MTMKKYLKTITVEAELMTRGKALAQGRAKLPSDDTAFYRVDEGNGYTSWLTREEFAETYKPIETPLDRMHLELEELSLRIVKALKFKRTETFNALSKIEKKYLERQIKAMECYEYYLQKRVELAEHTHIQQESVNTLTQDHD